MSRQRKRIPQEPFIATIESLSHDGRGISHIDGKITFIHGALPSEQVEARFTTKRGAFNEAITLNVLNASPDRVTPPCQHYELCGGCSMQHLDPSIQITHKQQVLLDQLKHFGKVTPKNILPPLTGPTLGYRRKARLGARYVIKKEKLLVGFRERNGRYIAEITNCPVLHPSVGEKILELQDLIRSLSQFQQIPQIEIAVGEERTALVIRHLEPLTNEDISTLCLFADKFHFDMYLQPKGPDTVHKIWPNDNVSRLTYSLPEQSIEMQFHPCDFTQVNQTVNRDMINQTIELLEPNSSDRILDLFCGLGNFSLALAKHCKEVIGVEGSKPAILRAQENAKLNEINNAQFLLANLSEDISKLSWANQKYDKILIDPPRSGAEQVIKSLAPTDASRIVYVSCNPATLARDAGILVKDMGYVLQTVGVMDMFPHTSHVESIALFVR